MADATHRGEFVWHDLMTPNAAGAHEFYGKVVGWKTQQWEKDASYTMFAARSGPIGGVTETPSATPHWLPYIGTTNVEATVEAATRLGARVQTAPAALPNGGRYAVLVDPQGAVFGVYSSSGSDAWSADTPQAGEFSWHELATSVAPNIAFAFYAALFDWDDISQHDMGAMGMYLIFGRNGRQLGGMFDKGAAGKPGSAYWLGYVSVTDLEGTVERAKAARGSLLMGPMDVPGGDRVAQLMDPYGAFLALHKKAGAGAASAAGSGDAAPRKPAKKAAAKPAAPKAAAPKAAAKKRPAKKAPAKRAKPAARKQAKKKPAPKKKSAARKPPKAKGKPKAKAKTKKKAKKRGR